MERVEAALKSSIRKDMAFKTTLPVYEDFHAVTTAEDFSVDDFFDLSNDSVFTEEEAAEPKTLQEMLHVSTEEPQDNGDALRQSKDDFGSLPPSELSIPTDELAELEWLSHFVEDSFTEYSAPNLTGTPTEKPAWLTGDRRHPLTPPVTQDSCFKSSVPSKARTKRNRNGTNFWSIGSCSSSGPSSSSSTSSSSSGPSNTWFSGAELLEPVSRRRNHRFPKSIRNGQQSLLTAASSSPLDGAATVAFRKRPSGEQDQWEPRRCAMRAGFGISRVGYYQNTDPLVAPHSQASSTLTTTVKS